MVAAGTQDGCRVGLRGGWYRSADKSRQAGQMALAALLLQSALIDQIFVVLLVRKLAATRLAIRAWPSWNTSEGLK